MIVYGYWIPYKQLNQGPPQNFPKAIYFIYASIGSENLNIIKPPPPLTDNYQLDNAGLFSLL